MNTAGCSARYQYSAVVPALAAPMTMKLGSIKIPRPLLQRLLSLLLSAPAGEVDPEVLRQRSPPPLGFDEQQQQEQYHHMRIEPVAGRQQQSDLKEQGIEEKKWCGSQIGRASCRERVKIAV